MDSVPEGWNQLNSNATHYMIQRINSSGRPELALLREKKEVLIMGMHANLGAVSLLYTLAPELVKRIVLEALPVIEPRLIEPRTIGEKVFGFIYKRSP